MIFPLPLSVSLYNDSTVASFTFATIQRADINRILSLLQMPDSLIDSWGSHWGTKLFILLDMIKWYGYL